MFCSFCGQTPHFQKEAKSLQRYQQETVYRIHIKSHCLLVVLKVVCYLVQGNRVAISTRFLQWLFQTNQQCLDLVEMSIYMGRLVEGINSIVITVKVNI